MDSIFFYRNPNITKSAAGPLQGMKIAVSPNIAVLDWPTEAGSQALAGFKALEDAAVVERLGQNGAIVVGSTHAGEFCFGLQHSTAGRAAEIQDAEAELMLDLAGEARLAACRAGLWSLKTSWGVVPRLGIVGLIPSMEACGILGKTPNDIRRILQAVAGPDERDFSQPDEALINFSTGDIDPEKVTLGVIEEAVKMLPGPERAAFQEEISVFQNAGFSIKTLSWPEYALGLAVHQVIGSVEASSCAGRYDSVRYGRRAPGAKNWNEMYLQARGASFGTILKSYLIQGAFFQFEQYAAYEDACRIRTRLLKHFEHLTAQTDALLMPVQNPAAPEMPATLAELYEQFIHTTQANVTGGPALSLPPAAAQRPGLQLMGPKNAEARLIALGEFLFRRRTGGI